MFHSLHARLITLLKALWPEAAHVSFTERVRACVGVLLGVAATGLLSRLWLGPTTSLPLLMAPVGASAVLLFAVPASPLAQPWALLAGNITAALIGVTCAQQIPDPLLASACAMAGAFGLMSLLRCIHPPSGAVALTAVLGGPAITNLGYEFVMAPVGLNSLLLLGIAILYNNATRRTYPHGADQQHGREEAPLERIGFTTADLDAALARHDQMFDISRDDLMALFHDVEIQAHMRLHRTLTCGQIMSRDVVAVTASTDIARVRTLLQDHGHRLVPVIDDRRCVLGGIDATAFLRDRSWMRVHGFRLRPRRTTADIMTRGIPTATADMPVDMLLNLLSSGDVHAVPIIDQERRLVGIVTQTDMLAALFRSRVTEAVASRTAG